MTKKELNEQLEVFDEALKKEGISRRDAMKMAAAGSAAFMLGASQASAATTAHAANAKGKILIVGGGLAGVSTAARLVNEGISANQITIIEPNPISVSYQPGLTLIGGGVYQKDDIIYETKDYVPSGVNWIHDKVATFDPDNNKVTTYGGKTVSYDYMIVATGLVLDFARIKGLEEIGTQQYTLGESKAANKLFAGGKQGLSSIYFTNGAVDMWNEMQQFVSDAAQGKKGAHGGKLQGVFTHPNTPIKCGGAPKKIMYLTEARLQEAGKAARSNADLTFYPNGGKMFGVKEYHDAIVKQYEARDMKWKYAHNLVAVDIDKKIATFDHHWKEKGAYDPDLEEYTMVTKHEMVKVPYDLLHITPPMAAPKEVANSPIGSGKGWVPVRKETLQHAKYKNIFALGDVAAVPMGKTGGSVRKQYKVLVTNLIDVMNGKEPTAMYEGYTVCPLITGLGTVMLAEFNWTKKPTPSFPLDPTQERWIWWLMKVYALKPMTVYGMLSGKA